MSLDEWKKVINLNLTSTFLCSKFGIKKMLKNKSGKIINITSVVGHTGNLGQSNYTASKAGIVAMSKSLAIEYAKKNININCISPGFIETAMTDKIDEKFKEVILYLKYLQQNLDNLKISQMLFFFWPPINQIILMVKHYMLMGACIWLDKISN